MEGAERSISIYALTDPYTGDVRYVGQTTNLWRRYTQHLLRPRGIPAKVAWLQMLRANGKVPGLQVLEVVGSDHADSRERWWIDWFVGNGGALYNLQCSSMWVWTPEPWTAEEVERLYNEGKTG